MRILHVLSSLDPKYGGPVEGVTRMASIHKQNGIEVEIVTADDPESDFLKSVDAVVHPLGLGVGVYSYNNKLIPWLKNNVSRFDAVVVNGIWQFHLFAIWVVLRKRNIPYFVYTHGMLDPWFKAQYPLKHLKKWLYWPWGVYPALKRATAVLFTCEEERRLASGSFWLYKANERVVSYGAATPPQDANYLRSVFFSKFPELNGKRLFLFLSRIQEKKGCDILIEAFSRVSAKCPDAVLVMAGPDQDGWSKDLKLLAANLGIADRFFWTGMLLGDLKWASFYASELFVLPSHQENFGIAVAESLGCGLPVLISNKVNIWYEIAADGAGLIGSDNLLDTENNLLRWLSMSSEEKNIMRAQARITFERRFTLAEMTNSLVRTIKEFVK